MPRPSFWFLLTVCTRSVFRGSWIHFCLFLLSFLIYPAEIVSNSFSVIISSFFQMNLLFITQSLLLIPILYHTLTICQWFFCILWADLPLFFFIVTVLLFVLHSSPFTFFAIYIPTILFVLCIPTRNTASKFLCFLS